MENEVFRDPMEPRPGGFGMSEITIERTTYLDWKKFDPEEIQSIPQSKICCLAKCRWKGGGDIFYLTVKFEYIAFRNFYWYHDNFGYADNLDIVVLEYIILPEIERL